VFPEEFFFALFSRQNRHKLRYPPVSFPYPPDATSEDTIMPDNKPEEARNPQQAPTYWFAVLEIARERGDFERAADAQRQLERLGIVVRYRPRGKGVSNAR
jgi:hypothetical protein